MEYVIIALKLIVGLSILNVWLLNKNNASQWRGGDANSMEEEFANYGLSKRTMIAVGAIKCVLSIALLISILYKPLEFYSALGIALMMVGAVFMHIKIADPIKKSFPAILFLLLSLIIAFIE